jgi:hypothetical protein
LCIGFWQKLAAFQLKPAQLTVGVLEKMNRQKVCCQQILEILEVSKLIYEE